MIHPVAGSLVFQPYGQTGQAINSISRNALNQLLISAAERSGKVSLLFGRRCTEVDLESGGVTTVDAETGGDPARHAGTVIGADGAYSVVGGQLSRAGRTEVIHEPLAHGYKELQLPAGPGGSHSLEPHALHIWPRGGYMMMAMANIDGSFTVTLYLAHEGPNSFAEIDRPERVSRFFEANFPDAVPLIPRLREEFLANPTGSLVTVRSRPWHAGGAVVLLGDACHAIVPFFGQGANAAFEGCLSLDAALARYPADRARAFAAYEEDRRPNADAIADLALQNFLEMRDRVASPLFRLEKRLERVLYRLFPGWCIPLYTMISFTTIPYAEARRRGRRSAMIARLALIAAAVLVALGFVALAVSY
jgi:kynurenine 3-monooxygenase